MDYCYCRQIISENRLIFDNSSSCKYIDFKLPPESVGGSKNSEYITDLKMPKHRQLENNLRPTRTEIQQKEFRFTYICIYIFKC